MPNNNQNTENPSARAARLEHDEWIKEKWSASNPIGDDGENVACEETQQPESHEPEDYYLDMAYEDRTDYDFNF